MDLKLPTILLGMLLSIAIICVRNASAKVCPQQLKYSATDKQVTSHISVKLSPQIVFYTIYAEYSWKTCGPDVTFALNADVDEIQRKWSAGLAVMFYVYFPIDVGKSPIPPILTLLTVNNATICTSASYTSSWLKYEPKTISVVRHLHRDSVAPVTMTPAPILNPGPATPTASASAELMKVCGREMSTTVPFIYHGTAVARGKLPWMAAIFQKQRDGLSFFCGGTLVSRSTVVSAAHCFRVNRVLTANRTVVSLGRSNLDDYTSGVLRDIEVVLVHQQYKTERFSDADIALLKLVEPVTFDNFIRPICLWNENYQLELPAGYKSYVAGWGADENGNSNTKIAKMTDIDVLSESQCRLSLQGLAISLVTARTICASNKDGAGPCTGDSGGGLMLNERNVWLLRGIVSAGQQLANRCDLTQPVIFCDLAKHIEWVRTSMWF